MARWCKRELLRVLPTFIFFFIALYIISLTEVFLLKKAGISPFTFVDIFVAAALIAKIFLVVDHLPFIDWVPRRPLIYRVLWKTGVYGAVVFLVRAALRWIQFLFKTSTAALAWTQFLTQVNWPLFFTIQAWFLLLLFLYVTAKELVLIIGLDEIRRIFFKKR